MEAPEYQVRPASLADADTLVHHRVAMFIDMGRQFDADALRRGYGAWLRRVMPDGTYRGWVVETRAGEVLAGGGIVVLPWPPGPTYPGDRLAFVYNVYTEPAQRGRGLARAVMHAIHGWCRAEGIASLALNASAAGQPLYESMGYAVTPNPMMFFALE